MRRRLFLVPKFKLRFTDLRLSLLGLGSCRDKPLAVAAFQQDDPGRTTAGLALVVEEQVLKRYNTQ